MRLISKTICLRFVEESDAEFILTLRSNPRYNRYLSTVAPDINAQKAWIAKYKVDEAENRQFYFIIETIEGIPCGTIRVYDLTENSFCWGSWILNEDKTPTAALESAFLIYQFGFETLGFNKSNFDVMKGNEKVVSFHKKMGAKITDEDHKNYYFEISRGSIELARKKFVGKLI